jgi:hypothetical protein
MTPIGTKATGGADALDEPIARVLEELVAGAIAAARNAGALDKAGHDS